MLTRYKIKTIKKFVKKWKDLQNLKLKNYHDKRFFN